MEKLERRALPSSLVPRDGDEDGEFAELASAYKQLNAPLGKVGLNSLALATRSIKAGDTTYAWYLGTIGPLTAQHDALADRFAHRLYRE